MLLDCAPQQHAQGYRINSTQAGFLESTLRQHADWRVQAPAAWRERAAAKRRGEADVRHWGFGTVLRPYQKQGVAWLRFLRENGFGGHPRGRNGRGKTPRRWLSLRSRRRREADTSWGTASLPRRATKSDLIVLPGRASCSTTEAKSYAGLEGAKAHGTDPTRQVRTDGGRMTSSSRAMRSSGATRTSIAVGFDTVCSDDCPASKNRQTQNAQAVKAVRAHHRLVLTGTPLEKTRCSICGPSSTS